MRSQTRNTLLQRGFDTALIAKIESNGHSVTALRALSKTNLARYYTDTEVEQIRERVNRSPIPPETLESILRRSGSCCCVCRNGISNQPYQIHHIRPFAETQDHSEGNLALVCPNHHAIFHEAPWKEEAQVHSRETWYSMWALASDFAAKGVAFPYGAFEPLDYTGQPNYGELVELGVLSCATALRCCPESLIDDGVEKLRRRRCLFVIGGSGMGKSTYAVGLAGRFAEEVKARVFRYICRQKDTDPLAELSQAIACVSSPTLFIFDDINAWAALPAIEKLASLAEASPTAYFVGTVPPSGFADADRLSLPTHVSQTLNWEIVRDTVTANLLKHEHVVVEYLRNHGPPGRLRVGLGQMDEDLGPIATEAARVATSVYDFVFHVRGSQEGARDAARAMKDKDDSYQPLLVAAIEQIAGFEQPVLPEQVVAALATLPRRHGLPAANSGWVESVFDRSVQNRHAIRLRGSYTTVHRRWAADFIDECLSLSSSDQCPRCLLHREVDVTSMTPERLMRLWSWIGRSRSGEKFIQEWAKGLSRADRAGICARMCDGGTTTTGFFAQEFIRLHRGDSWNEIAREMLEDSEGRLVDVVLAATSREWYGIRDLFSALQQVAPSTLQRLLSKWAPHSAAALVSATNPSSFSFLAWALGKAAQVSPAWAEDVGLHLDWAAFRSSLALVEPGRVDKINDLLDILATMRVKLMRSMANDMLREIGRILTDVGVDDLHFGFVDPWLSVFVALFDADTIRELSKADIGRWAKELSEGPPRRWRQLAEVSEICELSSSTVMRDVVRLLDRRCIRETISRHAETYRYEFRVLLHLLASVPAGERSEWASICGEQVEWIVASLGVETSEVLVAFQRLDPEEAQRLSKTYGVAMEPKVRSRSSNEGFRNWREACAAKDAHGEDYDTELLQFYDRSEESSGAGSGIGTGAKQPNH